MAATSVVRAGASSHGPDRGGLAGLTSAVMDEGTARFTAQQLAFAAERLGTNLSTSSGWDGSYVSLQCLAPHLAESLDLAAEVLLAPTFPPEEFARLQGQTLAALRAERDSAEALAHRTLLRALYDPTHPYHVPVDGSEETVAQLCRDELAAFHQVHFRPDRAAWVVAGDVDPDDLARLLDDRLARWSSEASQERPDVPETRSPSRSRILLVDRPGRRNRWCGSATSACRDIIRTSTP